MAASDSTPSMSNTTAGPASTALERPLPLSGGRSWFTIGAETPRSLLAGTGGGPALDLVAHAGVSQRGGVTEIAALGHVFQQPPHDLAATRLGQVVGEDDGLRAGNSPDLGGHVLAQRLAVLGIRLVPRAQGHE